MKSGCDLSGKPYTRPSVLFVPDERFGMEIIERVQALYFSHTELMMALVPGTKVEPNILGWYQMSSKQAKNIQQMPALAQSDAIYRHIDGIIMNNLDLGASSVLEVNERNIYDCCCIPGTMKGASRRGAYTMKCNADDRIGEIVRRIRII